MPVSEDCKSISKELCNNYLCRHKPDAVLCLLHFDIKAVGDPVPCRAPPLPRHCMSISQPVHVLGQTTEGLHDTLHICRIKTRSCQYMSISVVCMRPCPIVSGRIATPHDMGMAVPRGLSMSAHPLYVARSEATSEGHDTVRLPVCVVLSRTGRKAVARGLAVPGGAGT